MHKDIEKQILTNSRLVAVRSSQMPIIIGTIILAAIYFMSYPVYISKVFFGFAYLALSAWSFTKLRKQEKAIVRDYHSS